MSFVIVLFANFFLFFVIWKYVYQRRKRKEENYEEEEEEEEKEKEKKECIKKISRLRRVSILWCSFWFNIFLFISFPPKKIKNIKNKEK